MKMKKILSVILAAVMLLGCMSFTAFAMEDENSMVDCPLCEGTGQFYEMPCVNCNATGKLKAFVIDENGVLTAYNGEGGDVVIPDMVTTIGNIAWNDSITSIVAQKATTLNDNSVRDNGNLISASFPNVTSIGCGSFAYDNKLVSILLSADLNSVNTSGTFEVFCGTNSLSNVYFCANDGTTKMEDFAAAVGLIKANTLLGESVTISCLSFTVEPADMPYEVVLVNDGTDEAPDFKPYVKLMPADGEPALCPLTANEYTEGGTITPTVCKYTSPSSFLTSFTLNKDYNDKYITDAKTTKVNETVTFTITPITENAPEFDPDTFSMTVTDGVGSADVPLPATDDIDYVGDYWYKIEETAGATAGVDYDDATYYLHLIVSYKDGEFGFSSAAIHTTENGEGDDDAKITLVSNSYGEGTLTVGQVTTVNGEDSSEDTFEATVTFTLPEGTELCGDITYGDNQKVTFDEDGVGTVTIELKGGDTVTFENIPDGVTYTVEQTEKNEDKGYELDSVAFDTEDEDGDTVSDANIASGTIGDTADTVTITNVKTVPIDVGVILEDGAFIFLALGAITAGAWLVLSKRRKSADEE